VTDLGMGETTLLLLGTKEGAYATALPRKAKAPINAARIIYKDGAGDEIISARGEDNLLLVVSLLGR